MAIQLEDKKCYRRTDGVIERVMGTTATNRNWVWTDRCNWYERSTGFEIYVSRTSPVPWPRNGRNLIEPATEMDLKDQLDQEFGTDEELEALSK